MDIDFNIFAGGETGLLKGVNLNEKAVILKNFPLSKNLSREHQIKALSWVDENESEILIGSIDRTVSYFDTTTNSFGSSEKFDYGNGSLIGAFNQNSATVVGLQSGEVAIKNISSLEVSIIKTLTGNEYYDRIKLKPDLLCVKSNKFHYSQIATGGCENDLKIWDINKPEKPIFKAKNVSLDTLSLRVPIWVRDITFLPQISCLAVCSKYKTIRLYDSRAQAKPVLNFEWEDYPLTSIAAVPFAQHQLLVGSSHGRMGHFDLRNTNYRWYRRPMHVYKGIVGAVKDIVIHPSLPLIFCVSLDRILRVYHLETKEMLYKHFLSSRINCLVARKAINLSDFNLGTEDHHLLPNETVKIVVKKSSSKTKRSSKQESDNVKKIKL